MDPNSLLYFVQEGLAGIEPRAEDDEAQALPGLRPPPAMTQSTLGALLVERILGSAPEFQKAAMSGIWSEAALQTLFEEIAEASSAHSGVEAQGAFVALISMLLNSLSGGHSSQDDASFIEKTLRSGCLFPILPLLFRRLTTFPHRLNTMTAIRVFDTPLRPKQAISTSRLRYTHF